MARKNGKRRGGGGRREGISLAVIGGLVPLIATTVEGSKPGTYGGGGFTGAAHHFTHAFSGYEWHSGSWDVGFALKMTWLPLMVGFVIHKLAKRSGVNRGLRGLPFGIAL